MREVDYIELFILKCAILKEAVDEANPAGVKMSEPVSADVTVKASVSQFSAEFRQNAQFMAEHYKLFYMLENDIRRLIDETITEDNKSALWWDKYAPDSAKAEYKSNIQREQEAGFTPRSDNPLDYLTFGQLGDIIRANYTLFGGIWSNPKAMGRVMYSLNNLRGPIAHCGLLAEDEVDRLKLAVKDWFRLLEGPK